VCSFASAYCSLLYSNTNLLILCCNFIYVTGLGPPSVPKAQQALVDTVHPDGGHRHQIIRSCWHRSLDDIAHIEVCQGATPTGHQMNGHGEQVLPIFVCHVVLRPASSPHTRVQLACIVMVIL